MGNVEWIEADVRRPATLDALGIDGEPNPAAEAGERPRSRQWW
jgi:hypothetical protein